MSIFDSLSGENQRQNQPAQITPQQAMAQLQADPVGVLGKIGLNVPSGMNNPQQMVQHLMQTGQVPQNKLFQVMQMMGQMGRK